VNFESPEKSFVIFPDPTFRYPRGDKAGQEQAQAHERQLRIPASQLDWTV
jgi:hypothetical protein